MSVLGNFERGGNKAVMAFWIQGATGDNLHKTLKEKVLGFSSLSLERVHSGEREPV